MNAGEPADAHTADAGNGDPGDLWSRTTAPQSPFTTRQVGIGLVIFAVLSIVAFVLPLVVG